MVWSCFLMHKCGQMSKCISTMGKAVSGRSLFLSHSPFWKGECLFVFFPTFCTAIQFKVIQGFLNPKQTSFSFIWQYPIQHFPFFFFFYIWQTPKQLALHSRYMCDFPGSQTHDLGIATAMFCWTSYSFWYL